MTMIAAGNTLSSTMRSATTVPPPLIDENINPSAEASAAEWKAYVPSGDQRLVLSAIDNQLNADKIAWKEKHADKPNSAKEEFFMKCIDQTGESLKQQLESATTPADEEEVERVLDSFQTRIFSTRSSSPGCDNNDCDDESLSSVDDEEEEIDFDDNEIEDQDAYNQLKQLRSQAREISARVISIREETAGRAVDMTRRNLLELVRVHGFSENAEDESNETSEQADDANEKRDALNPMHIALQTLTASLQNVDSGLAEKLESMKETIGTIDSSVEKYQKMAQGDDSALSQTEKALFACEKPKEMVVESMEENESPMNPDKKLARLLAGFL
eukprot:CAMPEP_0201929524 /NCGR_PEP_ID=MMETSP0903-20130614/23183_1 /ASSEMBLY_ACC=CAM_ASM_000552 /TAXON_ID=420261 /ORGANISM="Thalassiosira antarctica, Strain CCMP982" /LENGTH=329 /DNA_ID=CAMNT_0048468327 /DNA_START=20 /DNA_END=1009 /DNA_ORIENTATION=-